MPASKIASVLVLKNTIPGGANEIRIVTNKGAAGASDTTGVHYLSPSTGSAPRSPAAAETSMVYRLPPAGSSKGPIVLVDGVKSSLTDIPAEDIASVEVLKGPAAAKVYSDPAAVNGVIKITTKRAKKAP